MNRALIAALLAMSACSASTTGTGGGSALGGGTGGTGGNAGGGAGGGSAAGGGSGGGSSGVGGGTSMGPGGGNPGVGGGSAVTFTKCAQFTPGTALAQDTVNEVSLAAGRSGEAFVAWAGQNTGLNAVHQFVDGGWTPFFESDGGQQFVQLIAGEDGEAHAVVGFKYYFHAAGNAGFAMQATRPYVMPEISAGGVAVSYNQNGFPNQLWFQKRTAGVWPTGSQMLTADAGVPTGTTYVAANGDAYILWWNTYTSAQVDGGGGIQTHRHVHLSRRSNAGALTGTLFVADETRAIQVSRNFQAQHLLAFVDSAAGTFELARLGLDGQLTDRRGFSGELVAFHIADDGSTRVVWYAAASGLTLEVQAAPGGQWTSSVLKALANGGTSNATRADTSFAFGPSGDGYQVENENNGTRFHAAHIAKTGTVSAAANVAGGFEGGGAPKKLAVGRDGTLYLTATGLLGADAGFAGVLRGFACQ